MAAIAPLVSVTAPSHSAPASATAGNSPICHPNPEVASEVAVSEATATPKARSHRRWLQVAVALWVLALSAVSLRLLVDRLERGNVYLVFAQAGRDWVGGESLYYDAAYLFRYPPAAAVLFAPFGLLPDRLGGLLWRLAGVAALFGAWRYWRRSPAAVGWSQDWDGLFWLCLLPLALGNVNNGQSNVLLAALLVVATAAVTRQAWWLAAACLAAAIHLKLYPIALALLFVILHPKPLAWRLAVGVAVGIVLPFACQRPDYVWSQYVQFLAYSPTDQRMHLPLAEGNRDLWMLIRAWQIPLPLWGYRLLQAGTALGLAVLAWRLRPLKAPFVPVLILGLSVGWMLLFGPATESATYMLAAPTLAYALVVVWQTRWQPWLRDVLTTSFILLTLSQAAGWTPWTKQLHALGLQPLGVLLAGGIGVLLAWRLACCGNRFPLLRIGKAGPD